MERPNRPPCPKCHGLLHKREEWDSCHLQVIACTACGWRVYPDQRTPEDDFTGCALLLREIFYPHLVKAWTR